MLTICLSVIGRLSCAEYLINVKLGLGCQSAQHKCTHLGSGPRLLQRPGAFSYVMLEALYTLALVCTVFICWLPGRPQDPTPSGSTQAITATNLSQRSPQSPPAAAACASSPRTAHVFAAAATACHTLSPPICTACSSSSLPPHILHALHCCRVVLQLWWVVLQLCWQTAALDDQMPPQQDVVGGQTAAPPADQPPLHTHDLTSLASQPAAPAVSVQLHKYFLTLFGKQTACPADQAPPHTDVIKPLVCCSCAFDCQRWAAACGDSVGLTALQ